MLESSVPTFTHSVLIEADAEALFDLTQDYAWRLAWDPFLSEARLLDCDRAEVGRRSWCVDTWGRGMETEYVSFRRPERAAVRMTKGPWIFRLFAGSWIYRQRTATLTEVTFKYRVESRIELGALSDSVMRLAFGRKMKGRLLALKTCVEGSDILDRFAKDRLH